MLNKLRNRFLVMCMAVTLLVLFTAFFAVYLMMSENIRSQNEFKLSTAKFYYISGSIAPSFQISTGVETISLPAFAIFVFEGGIGTIDLRTIVEITDELRDEAMKFAIINPDSGGMVQIIEKTWLYDVSPQYIFENGNYKANGNAKQITFLDITDSINVLRDLLSTFTIVGVSMFFAVFLISLFLANRSIKPIKLAWEKQRRFIADASHELKTPLSIITSNYDAILADEDETIKSQREWFDRMRFGLDRMSRLVNTLLTLGRIEDMKNNTTIEPFDIGVALHEVIGPFDTKIREKGIDIYCNISQEIIIRSNREMVKSIFEILFDNAVKYTDARGRISVELRREKRAIVFCVGNSGKGISKADLPKVFERFYRSDASRNSEGGHGLGLAIAKETLMKLGGKISVKSGNGWTTFVIEF